MVNKEEILKGVVFGICYSKHHLIHAFLVIPFGILVILSILYGFNILLSSVIGIRFPASVLGMLVNLIFLCLMNYLSNIWPPVDDIYPETDQSGPDQKQTSQSWRRKFSSCASWVLEHYLILIRPSMNFCLKWINVFFIPSFITLPLSNHITFIECLKIAGVFLVGGLLLMVLDVLMIISLQRFFRAIGFGQIYDEKPSEDNLSQEESDEKSKSSLNVAPYMGDRSYLEPEHDITTVEISDLRPSKTEPTAYSRPRRHTLDDALTDLRRSKLSEFDSKSAISEPSPALFVDGYRSSLQYDQVAEAMPELLIHSTLTAETELYENMPETAKKFPKTKKFAHPILILTFLILFVCFIGSLIYHLGAPRGFLDDLKFYKTGKTYLLLFNGENMYNNGLIVPTALVESKFTSEFIWPGCGDFLSSLMDVSIVSLSLPMFTHRKDFIRNFWILMPPLLISVALTFFCYPIICYKIGISAENSIGFIGRLVTLALGTPLILSLGGSVSLMAVCTILSGICGVLIGDSFFKLLRIPQNDYVTRGATLGINCGAIATAHLLNVDPRAASISSLSFSIFGTIMVIMASLGSVRDLIQSWVGM